MTAPGTVARWDDAASRDVVDGWVAQLAGVAQLAEYIAPTEFVPKAYRGQPAAVAAAILAGREMGIGPMTALQHLYVVEGRPAMSAQLMRAQVLAAGHDLRVIESTSARCTVVGRRKGDGADREPVTWSGDDVRRAGLANRPTWQRYPRQMLLARATAELCRAVFPDVLGGMTYAVEEAADIPADGSELVDVKPAANPRRVQRRQPVAIPDAAAPPPAPQPPGGAVVPAPDDEAPPAPPAPDLPPLPEDGPDTPPGADLSDEPAPDVPAHQDDAQAPPAPPSAAPDDDGAAAASTPNPDDDASDEATGLQRGKVFALLTDLGAMHPRQRRLSIVSALVGRTLATTTELTRGEASALIDTLARVQTAPDAQAELDWLVAQGTAQVVLGARDANAPTGTEQPSLLDPS